MYKKLDDNAKLMILETGIDEFAERGLDLMQAVEALRAEEELTMPQGPFYTVN